MSKICLQGIRTEFRQRMLGENLPSFTKSSEELKQLFSMAYKESSLICFGLPHEIVHLFSIEETIQIFEQALVKSQLRLPSERIIRNLEKSIEYKHLLDTGRGFMLVWFAKQSETETGQYLRQKAIAAFL